ncbi:tetratricopeptide repeat protein [Phenylobacterium sp.]|uniref:tetratricopeptide repeat protein n=1 Tax=Phenylobacterium sp. TaxID=1871053 RepID=UPI002F401C0E
MFGHSRKAPAAAVIDADVGEIQRALDERRYIDAGQMLDGAALSGSSDPRLVLLSGELDLARNRYADALGEFERALEAPATHAAALQGQGVALSLLGRSDKALAALALAVAADPSAWRAWNALASEYDRRQDWTQAESAYGKALAASANQAVVLNNRGYSRLLQHRPEEAVPDFVAALQKRPDLAEARTNLRLALAMKGDYGRATAAGANDDRAAILNNAGFAAALRGDYAESQDLLERAMKARSEYYSRASENLDVVRSLAARDKDGPAVSR